MPSYDKQRLRKTYSFFRARPIQLVTGDTSVSSEVMSGDGNATYLVLSATGSLSAERVFTPGTGLKSTDAGAGGAYTIFTDDSVIATVSGTKFTGPVSGSATHGVQTDFIHVGQALKTALSGAIRVAHGTPVVIGRAGSNAANVGVLAFGVDGSNTTTIGNRQGADHNVLISTTNTRFFDNTTQRALIDANGITANFTGSYTKLADGRSAFVGSGSISVISASDGQVTIGLAELTSSFAIATITSSFSLTGSGILTPVVWNVESDTRSLLKSGSRFYLPQGLWNVSIALFTTANQNLGGALRLNGDTIFARQTVANTGVGVGGVGVGTSTLLFVTGTLDYVEVLASGSAGGTITSPSRVSVVRVDNGFLSGSNGSSVYLAGLGLTLNAGTFAINDGVVATVTGTRFTGPVTASLGVSGTLGQFERLQVGTNGEQSTSGEINTPHRFSWFVRNGANSGDLLVLRHGVLGTDDLEIGDNVAGRTIRFYTGGVNTADFQHGSNIINSFHINGLTSLSITASQGVINKLTGSHTRNAAGLAAFVGVGGISITSGTTDQVFISGTAGEVVTPGTGLTKVGTTVSINNGVVATVSGTTFTGPINSTQITGSHTRTSGGLSAFVAGTGIQIASGSTGQVTISSTNTSDILCVLTESHTASTSESDINWDFEALDTNSFWSSGATITLLDAGVYEATLGVTNDAGGGPAGYASILLNGSLVAHASVDTDTSFNTGITVFWAGVVAASSSLKCRNDWDAATGNVMSYIRVRKIG